MARKPLAVERAIEILEKATVGRLGTARDGEPYVVPLSYVYYREKIYFHSNPNGRKIANLVANPRVCFQVDDEATVLARPRACNFTVHYYSVIVSGTARVVEEPELRLAALQALVNKYDPQGTVPPLTMEELDKDSLAIVEISPEVVSGADHARLPV